MTIQLGITYNIPIIIKGDQHGRFIIRKYFRVTTWGESHGKGLGVVVDGVPAGLELCEEDIQIFLNRRKPGQSKFTTPRKEDDAVEILSGVFEGKTTGTPVSMVVWNKIRNQRITVRLLRTIVRGMLTFALMRNTASETTEAEVVLRDARQ